MSLPSRLVISRVVKVDAQSSRVGASSEVSFLYDNSLLGAPTHHRPFRTTLADDTASIACASCATRLISEDLGVTSHRRHLHADIGV